MLFNSAEYLLAFLPLSFFLYFQLTRRKLLLAGRASLVLASLFFYGWWNPANLWLILFSIIVNFAVGRRLTVKLTGTDGKTRRKLILLGGIAFNLGLLAYFKYADFVVGNLNGLMGSDLPLPHVVLPIAVSFFTFTQIAYLVDCHRGEAQEYDVLRYFLFVTFFPHLIAGPILHHKEMMPQFASARNSIIRYPNIALGLFLLSIGLFKKVIVADSFAKWATAGFDQAATLSFFEAWAASLSYTFQLYFDFGGYTDMALGSALLFNIRLPINFNSPYKAVSIQDFWHRWHMTLSRFLRDYLYLPLGGNRRGIPRTLANLFLTFVLGGLWHGAGWMFVAWGALHGTAMVVHRVWRNLGGAMPQLLAWFITFNFVNLTWVFFRAREMKDALKVLSGMAGLNGIMLPQQWSQALSALNGAGIAFGPWLARIEGDHWTVLWLAGALVLVLAFRNSNELAPQSGRAPVLRFRWAAFCAALMALSMVAVLSSTYSEFIYFNF